jgi:hypothetical protein
MGVRYATGSGRAVVRGDVVVVLPQPPEHGVLDRLWQALDPARGAEPGVMDALQVLTDGVGLHGVPPFAVAVVRGGDAHVLVRGACLVELESGDGGAVTVDGAGVATWSERTVRDVVGLSVRADGGSGLLPVQGTWPLAGGVVAASAVGVRLALVARPDEAGASAPGAARAGSVVAAEPVTVGSEESTVLSAAATPDGPAEPVGPAAASVPAEPLAATDGWSDADASPDTLLPEHSTIGVVAAPAAQGDGIATAAVAAAVEAPVPAAAEPPAEPVEETYGHLWGQTVMRGVEAAAVRPDEDDEDGDGHTAAGADAAAPTPSFAPPPSPTTVDPTAVDPAAAPVPSAPPAAPAAPATAASSALGLPEPPPGILAGVPKVWDASPVPPPAPAPAPAPPAPVAPQGPRPASAPTGDLDHDGNTVLSSAVADLRAAAGPGAAPGPADASTAAGPQILARTCPQGHPNPPSWERCRTCQAELTGDAALAPRPLLGRMRTSAGEVVELDRTVVVGRRPRAPRTSGGDGARLVTVDSPSQDISRSHVEVRLEGWHVLVSDMATTNGTTLLRPGQPPRRLHPGEGVLVADGDVVDLGDGVTLGFEEIW